MSETNLTCIRCEKQMMNYLSDAAGWQPNDGLFFWTHGHYGSTYFDPMDAISWLAVCICDECVKDAEAKGRVLRYESPTNEVAVGALG